MYCDRTDIYNSYLVDWQMKLQPTNPVNFGIYQQTKITRYGKIDKGIINGKKLDIYTSYENGKVKHRLYYLTDLAGNWIKSKLKYFDDKGELKTIRSTNYGK